MKKLIIVMSINLLLFHFNASAVSPVVFDPTNWLTAIDQLYSAYDQIMNSVEQIKQNYEMLKKYADAAITFNWEDVSNSWQNWDGDFDFRDEIKGSTAAINRQLDNIRKVEYYLTSAPVKLGNYTVKMSDLFDFKQNQDGFYTPAGLEKTISTVFYDWMWNDNVLNAMRGFTGKMTDKQKAAIWRKYNLSPENFYYLKTKKDLVLDISGKIIGKDLQQAVEDSIKESESQMAAIVESLKIEGLTEGQILQQTVVQNKYINESINDLHISLNKYADFEAQRFIYEQEKKDIQDQQLAAIKRTNESNKPGGSFLMVEE